MNDSLRPLLMLLEQAESERNAALAALNERRKRCLAAQDQARQLDDHRNAYRQRWSVQFAHGAALPIVRCHHAFADRLDAAIGQQCLAVRQAEAVHKQAGQVLNACELRVASVRKLIERRAQMLRQQGERRDQKESDEQAMRVHAQRRSEAAARRSVGTP